MLTEAPSMVRWTRKSGFLMLMIVVLWTAMPALACLLPARHMSHAACCDGMAATCPPVKTAASGSCCQFDQKNIPATPESLSTSEHVQASVILTQHATLLTPPDRDAARLKAVEAPPPNASPGDIFTLRI